MTNYKRNGKGQFVKGSEGVKHWQGKKRGETSKDIKDKISNSLTGFKRTDENKKNIGLAKIGNKNPSYKSGRNIMPSGYILILKKEHPFCNVNGYVYEHRLIVEKSIGRYLNKKETIHHIDSDPSNNKINNLFLTTRGGNIKAHYSISVLLKDLLKDNIIKFNNIKGIYERC